jgi:5-(carboxyamino)imidazole ribonucleotide synthase
MKVGIVGGGQLARMMALAGYPLGLEFLALDPNERASAGQVAPILPGNFADVERLRMLAQGVHVMTFDLENVPATVLEQIDATPLYPPVEALATCQDRLNEKQLFESLGITTAAYRTVNELDELLAAVGEIGTPCVLKTRRLGYDGRGQRVLRSEDDVEPAWQALRGVPLLLEQYMEFEREVSVIGVRGRDGEVRIWPLTENLHHDGILVRSLAPLDDAGLTTAAEKHLTQVMTRFDYVGVLTIEFFVCQGALVANEMAPRVHNSGHWTIEGAETSQFENHLRAILGWPLGDTGARGASAMLNLIGIMPHLESMLAVEGAHVHSYGKSARPGRKLGHCTVVGATPAERDARLARLQAHLAQDGAATDAGFNA